jgi:RNA polymerase sigma factor (sigma-70 family)
VAISAKPEARSSAPEPSIPGALLTDERLARLVAGGSERAFQTIYERYHQQLYRYCHSLLRNGDDAYDALQSTLVSALAALQRGQRDAPLRPWLFRIAHNEASSQTRRRGPVGEPAKTIESYAPSAEDRAGERARLALLAEDLRELPERERGALLMRELSGLSHQEIAATLGISTHAVRHAIFAARRSLGEFEEGRAMMCEDVRRSISHGDARVLARARARAHLRGCAGCAAFAAAIPARRADLLLLAPPLAPVLAAGLLASLHGTASATGAGSGIAAGIAGNAAGAAVAAKVLVGVVIVASAGASIKSAASPAERHAAQRSTGQVAPARTRRAQAPLRERPARARVSREPRITGQPDTPVAVYAERGRPPAAIGNAQQDAAAAASSASSTSATKASAGGAGQLRPPEVDQRAPRAQSSGKSSNDARHPGGVERRSAVGAQHARGPSKTSDAPLPAHGPGDRTIAAGQHPRGFTASEAATPNRGGQSGQAASAGDRAMPNEAQPPPAEGRGRGAGGPAQGAPSLSAPEGVGSQAEPARTRMAEPSVAVSDLPEIGQAVRDI